MRFIIVACLLFFSSLSMPVNAAEIGQPLPHPLTLQSHDEAAQSFEALSGENGLVLVFVRSLDWCPFCKKQIIELNERASEITARGYNIAALSYDDGATLSRFHNAQDIDFTLLSDPQSEAIKAFGLFNADMKEGSKYYGIPYPAIMIIGQDGQINAKLAEDGYKNRPSVDAIIEALP